ncbi:MAG: hypothetical protein CO068_08815 [Flavobacteriaceae bacterium CG_4_9_14_0_8_um_filter_34_30]|nr:MAG: hypothetical protein CO068_08815 [Flavobacteriaceae bacterium CG_4_9_14_0_8_um_filter_34_30]
MAKRVFFSFHHDDVKAFRANVVRQHWVTKPNREAAGFFDASIWEKAKKTGPVAIKRMINSGLKNTSNTCVLIGTGTYARPWVRYEIFKSMANGNHVFGVHINGIKDRNQQTKNLGKNPFDYVGIQYNDSGTRLTMYQLLNGKWIEYSEINGSPSYSIKTTAKSRHGKFFKLSHFYKTYKWNKDKGYNNFGTWTK